MRARDLLPAFADVLERLNKTAQGGVSGGNTNAIEDARNVTDFDSEDASEAVYELMEYLNEYAPAYGYFGAHPGDGSDYGFWLHEDFRQMIVDDGGSVGDELPSKRTESGEFLVVNDHGNCTLYAWNPVKNTQFIHDQSWREVWAIV
jgi:hypothetical protein